MIAMSHENFYKKRNRQGESIGIKFQQLNSELSLMKHFQEVFKSDIQAVKIC